MIDQAAVHLDDSNHFVAGFRHQAGGVRSHVAEALHDDAGRLGTEIELLDRLVAHDHDAASGGLAAAARAANIDGLAGDHRGHGLAHVHGVCVHHPRHGLFVGVHVGRGNIFFRTDELDQLRGIAAGHALQFALGHLVGIADHSTLGATEGNVDYGALPGHPTGQGADFVEGNVGRVAQAALGRTARDRVLHPEAGEDFEMAVVHHDRNVQDDLPGGIPQDLHQSLVQVQLLGSKVETGGLCLPRVDFLLEGNGLQCHGRSPLVRSDSKMLAGAG